MTAAVSPGSRSAWNIGPAVCEEAAAQEGGQRGIKDEYADVIGSIKRLNETIRHQQGIYVSGVEWQRPRQTAADDRCE